MWIWVNSPMILLRLTGLVLMIRIVQNWRRSRWKIIAMHISYSTSYVIEEYTNEGVNQNGFEMKWMAKGANSKRNKLVYLSMFVEIHLTCQGMWNVFTTLPFLKNNNAKLTNILINKLIYRTSQSKPFSFSPQFPYFSFS